MPQYKQLIGKLFSGKEIKNIARDNGWELVKYLETNNINNKKT